MGEIELPWLEPGSTVSKALDRLIEVNTEGRKAGRGASAVATRVNSRLVLISAEAIVEAARTSPRRRLSTLEPVEAPMVLSDRAQELTQQSLNRMLDSHGSDFAIEGPSRDSSRIVTRHEGLMARYGGHFGLCRCTGVGRHPWLAQEVPNKTCKKCGASVACS